VIGPGLGPDARALLGAAIDADDPSADDAARVRAKIAARIGVATAAGTAAGLSAKTAVASLPPCAGAAATTTAGVGGTLAGSSALGAKIALAVVLAGAAGTGAVVLRDDVPMRAQTAASSTATPARPRAASPASAPVAGAATEESAPPTAVAPPPIATRTAPEKDARSASVQAPPAPPSRPPPAIRPREPARDSGGDAIAEEAMLLRSAQAALARGDGSSALIALEEHATRFPRGALQEEREAARVFALCASGRAVDARTAASTFVAANPRSVLAAQVRRTCASR
jgi:hypothetical protein